MIKAQTTKKKETSDVAPKGTGSGNPSTKRKQPSKGDRPPKKPKVPLEPVVGLMAEGAKIVTPAKHGAGKGTMEARSTNQEKPPLLLREDSKYALEQLSSIITSEDYEDLGNHSMEAMGETGLFAIVQVILLIYFPSVFAIWLSILTPFFMFQAMIMMKGPMGRCLTHETALGRVRAKAELTEDEMNQLQNWKSKMEKKFELSERVRKELKQRTEEAKKAFEDKDKELQDLKDQLRLAKEVAIREYRDSNALLSELEDSYLQGFDDALHQVQKAYPNLDVSNIKVEDQAQTSVIPIALENTEDLFAEDVTKGNEESAQA